MSDIDEIIATKEPRRDVYSVSRLNREARILLERGLPLLWIEGEISNFSCPSSGHWYFSLKDEQAQVRCAMFRQRNSLLKFTPANGSRVLTRARVSLYEPRGDYQLIVEHIEDAGEGALRRQFELLKAKLQKEGLFAAERKRPVPRIPQRIGIITSPTGAAVRDILHILARRYPAAQVLIYPVPVQGATAAAQIAAAVQLASRRAECDVLILARGGGSLEDLWAFNDEALARVLAVCSIPVVTGIGHEIDFTIADFVADIRAPTPSGAAELVTPDGRQLLDHFGIAERRMTTAMQRLLQQKSTHYSWLQGRLAQTHPGVRLAQQGQRLDEMEQRLCRALRQQFERLNARLERRRLQLWRHSPLAEIRTKANRCENLHRRLQTNMRERLNHIRARIDVAARGLHACSPLATLERGYAIVVRAGDGQLLRSTAQVAAGDLIEARLHRGRLRAKIEDISE